MIESLQNELYQLEKKQAKGSKLGATLLWLIVANGSNCECKFLEETPFPSSFD